jgi:hypothetical protein
MKSSCLRALASAIILTLCAIPAKAQPFDRTWVSGTDADGGMCGSITSPCASFNGALANTNAGGEIDCLGPGDFGNGAQVLINQSVSIVCDGVSNGGILTSAFIAGIAVNAGSGAVVYLSGLALNGLAGKGTTGVGVLSGSTVYIVHCSIRGFSGSGVSVNSSANPTRVFIKDSMIVNNNGGGVSVQAIDGATNAAILVNSVIDGNAAGAATANAASGPSVIALENTVLSGSATGLSLQNGAIGELIGPSNAIAGSITGTTTSVPFK